LSGRRISFPTADQIAAKRGIRKTVLIRVRAGNIWGDIDLLML